MTLLPELLTRGLYCFFLVYNFIFSFATTSQIRCHLLSWLSHVMVSSSVKQHDQFVCPFDGLVKSSSLVDAWLGEEGAMPPMASSLKALTSECSPVSFMTPRPFFSISFSLPVLSQLALAFTHSISRSHFGTMSTTA